MVGSHLQRAGFPVQLLPLVPLGVRAEALPSLAAREAGETVVRSQTHTHTQHR